jgi:uncharacterized short protein YbdD (DUF466 family)
MNASVLRERWRNGVAAARRVFGIPDYEAYVAHLRAHHPERALPSRETFFHERLAARYTGRGGRCC